MSRRIAGGAGLLFGHTEESVMRVDEDAVRPAGRDKLEAGLLSGRLHGAEVDRLASWGAGIERHARLEGMGRPALMQHAMKLDCTVLFGGFRLVLPPLRKTIAIPQQPGMQGPVRGLLAVGKQQRQVIRQTLINPLIAIAAPAHDVSPPLMSYLMERHQLGEMLLTGL